MTTERETRLPLTPPNAELERHGLKTQSRRVIVPQPPDGIDALHDGQFRARAPYELQHPETGVDLGYGFETEDQQWKCPYGSPGDALLIAEQHRYLEITVTEILVEYGNDGGNTQSFLRRDIGEDAYEKATLRKRRHQFQAGRYCPKWACRGLRDLTAVRVERVQEISKEDAWAEGCPNPSTVDSRQWYAELWDSLNSGPREIRAGSDLARWAFGTDDLYLYEENDRQYWGGRTDGYRGATIITGTECIERGKPCGFVSYPWAGEWELKTHRGLPWRICPNPWVWVPEWEPID